MSKYQLTEKGIQEARKKRTVLKAAGEAVTFGGPFQGEEYSNQLLITLLGKPRKARDAHELTIETFNRPRPNEAKISRVMGNLTNRGFVKVVNQGVYSDPSGNRLTRRRRRGWRRIY